MSDPKHVLGLFAKWPIAGTAKTRLTPGNPLLELARVAGPSCSTTLDRLAMGSPPDVAFRLRHRREARADFETGVAGRFELDPQSGGDLGLRMRTFFERRLAEGATAVVVLGADSPTLPSEIVQRAYAALETADVVIGPAADGGYYLIGCGRRLPPVLDGIDWGTNLVLGQTVTRLTAGEWRLAVLPPWYDVDTPGDWATLAGHVAALRRAGTDPGVPRTEALLREIGPNW